MYIKVCKPWEKDTICLEVLAMLLLIFMPEQLAVTVIMNLSPRKIDSAVLKWALKSVLMWVLRDLDLSWPSYNWGTRLDIRLALSGHLVL